MRFMLLVKADPDSESTEVPDARCLASMRRFNQEMAKAGVLLAAAGLLPGSGARIAYAGDRRIVTDGPFAEAGEAVAGFWLIEVRSRAEAVEWASRAPFREGEVEVRQAFDPAAAPSADAGLRP